MATVRGVALTADDRLRRDVIERLMCELEVDLHATAALHAADPASLTAAAAEGIKPFIEDGLAAFDGRRIVVSDRGRPFVRSVAALFDAYLARDHGEPRHSRVI